MIYQVNVILSVTAAIASAIFLVSYIRSNKDTLFFWDEPCENGFSCSEMYMEGPPKTSSPEFKQMIKERHLFSPPKSPTVGPFDIYSPVWRKLVDWYKVQENILRAFQNQSPGFFVEVGAVDGDFMSQTLALERNLSWTGLLLEPDPRSFLKLQQAKRNAWVSNLCINYNFPSLRKYWIRTIDEDLPHHFIQLLMARSKLYEEILSGDEERGASIWVPCVPLSSVLKAMDVNTIDLLTIATGGDNDEEKIKDVLYSKTLTVKSLLIHYPTSRLFGNPYPMIPGYIMDAGRSEMLIKYYIKEKYCDLISEKECHMMNHFDVLEACFTYQCFGYLTVKSYDPDRTLEVRKDS